MNLDELRSILEENMNLYTLLDEIGFWFGTDAMTECYENIAKQWDIELESED